MMTTKVGCPIPSAQEPVPHKSAFLGQFGIITGVGRSRTKLNPNGVTTYDLATLNTMARPKGPAAERQRWAKRAKKNRIPTAAQLAMPPLKQNAARAKPRWSWKTTSKRQIRKQVQLSANTRAINRTAFRGIVNDICQDLGLAVRWEILALKALQDVLEPLIVERLAAANAIVVDCAHKPTLTAVHMTCVSRIQHIMGDPKLQETV